MPDSLAASNAAQQARILTTPLEILAVLRPLLTHHIPMMLHFTGGNLRFQSYLIRIDTDYELLAFDELIPSDGEHFLRKGLPFRVESFHDGVRLSWTNEHPVQHGELDGLPCHWLAIPDKLLHYQRRLAYRASLMGRVIGAQLSDPQIDLDLSGALTDISATGCQLQLPEDLSTRLQPGAVYEHLRVNMPFGCMDVPVELRHLKYEKAQNSTFCGFRFHRLDGLQQRELSRFIAQLQRELRYKT